MAGFEVVVRPVVFPDIRPQPARSLPPADDPEQGFAVIRGNGGKALTLSNSWSMSSSQSRPTETERRVDTARVYQMDDKGKVNRKNFIDVEVANRINKRGGAGPSVANGAPMPSSPEELKRLRAAQDREYDLMMEYFRRVQEQKNIEIKKRDEIRKNEEANR